MVKRQQIMGQFLQQFFSQLVLSGVTQAVICPGSRSTPLALSLAHTAGIRSWMHIDERSAAFFALGMARASGKPVALVSTSGSAAANFFPAVTEAYLSRLPLIILTADRPRELRQTGAAQTINQVGLYGSHVKWFMDMPDPSESPEAQRYALMVAAQAVVHAMAAPKGPVHVNFPLREPLIPQWPLSAQSQPMIQNEHLVPSTAMDISLALAQFLSEPYGLIVAGPEISRATGELLHTLSTVSGWPLLADPLSNLRTKSHVIGTYDVFLRNWGKRLAHPKRILRIGAPPTSKVLNQWIEDVPLALIDDLGSFRDPSLNTRYVLSGDATAWAHRLAHWTGWQVDSNWRQLWQDAEGQTIRTLQQIFSDLPQAFEGQPFYHLTDWLCPHSDVPLLIASSMPIRDLDSFAIRQNSHVTFHANRGTNGIDGLISTALGLSAVRQRVVAIVGDLAFYHDMNGLMAAHLHQLNALVVVINNSGGGIFSFLPQAQLEHDQFEELFGTPHHLDFSGTATLYGAEFERVDNWISLRNAAQAWWEHGGLKIVEWQALSRAQNVAIHRQIWAATQP